LAERGQGWQGSKTQAYWLVVRVLLTPPAEVVRVLLTPPAEAAASQKWKIIYLQVLRLQLSRIRQKCLSEMETSASDRRDGGHVIAEYDDSGLLRKYIYNARVDEPVCMIDVADSNAAYYYHFDGLGSVVALSDSTGEVVEQYVYDVFGQPALQGSPSTVGNTQVFSSTTTDANRRAMPFTMSENGTIQSVSIYHEGGTGNLILAVYDDSSGLPNTRLGVTQSTSINGSAGWQTVELTSPVDVEEDQTIWLAWVFESNPGIRFETGSPGRANSAQTWSGGMPATFGSSTTDNYIYSIYATYTTEQEEAPELIGNPYMFTGRRFDIETGLYYYRARYYNPHIGRFMQTDPVGYSAGMNLYLYCNNNPLGLVDPFGLYSVKADIPLQTIWHQSSMGYDDTQHKIDVQSFLYESNFFGEFPGVTLESVTFSGSSKEGTYKCIFEVPDEYTNMDMDKDDSLCGIPILVVETGSLFNKERVSILDWRLLGMLDDKLRGIQVSDIGGAMEQKFLSDLLNIIGTYSNDIYLGALSHGISVFTFYYTVAYPSSAVPNFSTWESYYTYLENMAEGGYDAISNTQYDVYKAKYGHLNKF